MNIPGVFTAVEHLAMAQYGRTPVAAAIDVTLKERGHKYGDSFAVQATVSQNIKRAMAQSPNWDKLTDDKREALSMIAVKISRILNGDPEYLDSWHDITGYAKLIEDSLTEENDNGRD